MTTTENEQREEAIAQLLWQIHPLTRENVRAVARKVLELADKPRTVATVEGLAALSRGDVVVSPFWTDAYSYIGGEGSPTKLQNVTTGAHVSVSEFDDFLPAAVVHEFAWAK